MIKDLFLIRHAESGHPANISDFERPLNEKGLKEADKAGRTLANHEITPEFIISSPAKRALSTAMVFAEHLEIPNQKIQMENMIYEASVSSLLSLINHLPNKQKQVALFGHNPSISAFAEYLSGESVGNMPTAGIIHIRFELDDWKLVSKGTGEIKWQASPKS